MVEGVKNEHGGLSVPGCAWGAKIEAAFGARPKPTLPEGWSRVFESHWDCAPAVLFYAPGDLHEPSTHTRRIDPVLKIHGTAVEVGIYCDYDDATQFAAVVAVAAEDQRWLRGYEGTCCCDHKCVSDDRLPGPAKS